MPVFFSSPEFGDTPIHASGEGEEAGGVLKLRLDIFRDDNFYELYLIDRAYLPGRAPADVRTTSQSVHTSFIEALTAMDDFVIAYQKVLHEDRLEHLKKAFNSLATDPAAKEFEFPVNMFTRELMRYQSA